MRGATSVRGQSTNCAARLRSKVPTNAQKHLIEAHRGRTRPQAPRLLGGGAGSPIKAWGTKRGHFDACDNKKSSKKRFDDIRKRRPKMEEALANLQSKALNADETINEMEMLFKKGVIVFPPSDVKKSAPNLKAAKDKRGRGAGSPVAAWGQSMDISMLVTRKSRPRSRSTAFGKGSLRCKKRWTISSQRRSPKKRTSMSWTSFSRQGRSCFPSDPKRSSS